MRKLDSKQMGRLAEVISEFLDKSNVRHIAKTAGCSFGYISEISNRSIKEITEGTALLICKGLGANPLYVLDGIEPRYANWDISFSRKH
jgi:hypothetical protein